MTQSTTGSRRQTQIEQTQLTLRQSDRGGRHAAEKQIKEYERITKAAEQHGTHYRSSKQQE
jgi:hypothetical protein